jgi:chemotaxis protein CheY-P-specific phosphatase CheC
MSTSPDLQLAELLETTLQETAFALFDPAQPGAVDEGPYVVATLALTEGHQTELRLYVPCGLAQELSCGVLGVDESTVEDAQHTVGELLNIMAGGWLATQPGATQVRTIDIPRLDTVTERPISSGAAATLWVNGLKAITLEAVKLGDSA